jgi:hypothetical protein
MAAAAKAARALAPLVPNSAEAARQPLRLMAHYNRWAHEKLHDALRPLSREELHRDTGLVFKSEGARSRDAPPASARRPPFFLSSVLTARACCIMSRLPQYDGAYLAGQ